MVRLDPFEFQQLVYEEQRAHARGVELKALAILVLDGLLIGIYSVSSTPGGQQIMDLAFSWGWVGVASVVILLLACLCAVVTLWARISPLVFGQPAIPSYDEYRQVLRRLAGDAVLEELARRTWEGQRTLQAKQAWLKAALILTLAGLVLLGLFVLPAVLR